jgi:ppGpp synthetase/RelA/SpoT-type nucleotidyltranferase
MPPRVELDVSRKQITKAGKRLRDAQLGGEFGSEQLLEYLQLVSDFRKAHAYPLQMVAAKTRYYVGQHCPEPMLVAQRLKRLPTIIEKLVRTPAMALVTMEDIGGCRAVVTDESQIRAMVAHMNRRWKSIIVRERDYIVDPKPETGYRAYHLVVEKLERRIEIQIRTQGQHAWAEFVEQTDRRNPGLGLKAGTAPAEVLEYFRLGAELTAALERGDVLTEVAVGRLRAMHVEVGQPLQEGRYGAGA